MAADPDDLLAGLDDQQRAAVTHPSLPLLVLAGAGSGKTRVLTRRIAWRCATGADDPRRLLALTFTRAAAVELQQRLRLLGLRDAVRAGTFHAVAWAELRAHRAEQGRPPPTLLERPGRLLARLLPDRIGSRAVADLAGEIAWARARLVTPAGYPAAAAAAGRRPPIAPAQVVEVSHRYAEEKRRRGLVDFDDLLELLADAMASDPTFAAAQRWRSVHLYVDEYQDLNPLQARLLDAWLGSPDQRDRGGLCAVGDPNQAIYAWNGADPGLLDAFETRHPGAAVLPVDRSYRSTPEVLAVANALLDAGRCGGVRLRAVRAEGPVPLVAGFPDADAEARAIARAVLDHRVPGAPWSHQAVLARTNAQLDAIEAALRGVGAPVRVRGRTPFAELPAVRAALRELATTGAGFDAWVARVAGVAERAEPVHDEATDEHGDDPTEQLLRLVEHAEAYRANERRPDATGLRAWLAAHADDGTGPGDGVDLRTFHGAKGLEWPIVHVCGVEDGLVPLATARTAEALAEERRLLYVAVTRAERVLRVTWAASRAFGSGESAARRPSPFLLEVAPVLDQLRAEHEPADWREHLPAVRPRRPARAAGPEDALRSWRAHRARIAGVAPHVVLTDRALRALVDAAPADADAVAAVPGARHLVAAGLVDDVLAALHGTTLTGQDA